MKIVTGYRGEPHITSQDHQSFYQGVFGRQMYVLGTGNEFEAQLTDTNTITVSDGDGIMQGCHFRIDLGEEENIVMQPGSSGMYRNDLLVARYSKDAATGVEDVSLVTITGTPRGDSKRGDGRLSTIQSAFQRIYDRRHRAAVFYYAISGGCLSEP